MNHSPQEAYVLESYSSYKIREFTISFLNVFFFTFFRCYITSLKWRGISSFHVLTANTLGDFQFLRMYQGLYFFSGEKRVRMLFLRLYLLYRSTAHFSKYSSVKGVLSAVENVSGESIFMPFYANLRILTVTLIVQ